MRFFEGGPLTGSLRFHKGSRVVLQASGFRGVQAFWAVWLREFGDLGLLGCLGAFKALELRGLGFFSF